MTAIGSPQQARAKAGAVFGHRAIPPIALAAIFGLSVVVYSIVAGKHALPDLFPDEMLYAKLSQSFAAGHGLSWRGSGTGLPPLWPIVLSLAWHTGSAPDGYAFAKVLGSVLASATVVPVWLLGRELVGPRLALVPAALCVTGAWMETTSFVVSDNLAYPLATASLACMVMALRDTRARWMLASLLFAIPAALTRTQMLALPVILVVALVIDVLRQPPGGRRARIDARPRALWLGLVLLVAGGLLAFVVKPDLTNYAILAHHVSAGDVARSTAKHALTSIVMFAFVPVAAAVALMLRPDNWRDDRAGPLLATILAAALVMYPLLGRFEAFATNAPVDRYAMYLAPLLLLALVLAPGRIGRWTAIAAAAAVVALLFALPLSANHLEQPALFGTQTRIQDLGGFFADHVRVGTVVIAWPLTLIPMVALSAWERRGAALALSVVVVAGVMVAQAWTSQDAEIKLLNHYRTLVAPPQLDWVDRHADGRVANLDIGKPQGLRGNNDLYTDFFNTKVDYMYSTVPAGGECRIHLGTQGALEPDRPGCAAWPRNLVIQDSDFKITLRGQRVLASTRTSGTLVRIPPGPPHALSIVRAPCGSGGCTGALELGLYLNAPGRVTVAFGAAAAKYRVRVAEQTRVLPAGRATTFGFDVPSGDHTVNLPVNWRSPTATPALESVTLSSGGANTRLW
jgi:hypothetical protein